FEKNVSEERRIPFNQQLVKKLEEEFMGIERELIDQKRELTERYDELLNENNELHTSTEEYVQENQQLSNELQKCTENEQQYLEQLTSLKEKHDQLLQDFEAYQRQTRNEAAELTSQVETYKHQANEYK